MKATEPFEEDDREKETTTTIMIWRSSVHSLSFYFLLLLGFGTGALSSAVVTPVTQGFNPQLASSGSGVNDQVNATQVTSALVTVAETDLRVSPAAKPPSQNEANELQDLGENESWDEADDKVPDCRYKAERIKKETDDTPGEINHGNQDVSLTPLKDDIEENTASPSSAHSRVRRRTVTLHGPRWTDKNNLFVELVVVADHGFCQMHGLKAVDRILKIVGYTNAIYEPLGVVVVVSDIILWRSRNEEPVYGEKERTLASIQKYRERKLKENPTRPNDNMVLFTTALDKGSGGVASIGGMCSPERSVSVVQDVNNTVGVVGLFFAHEMGHNFAMQHDGTNNRCIPGSAIMSPNLSAYTYDPNAYWSDCSRGYIEDMKKTVDLDCLKDVPENIYPVSSCGNGIVEYGEECDCGPADHCKNRCCNPRTCRFAPNAKCASGACCNTATCEPHRGGTVCREAHDSCDLPEYCSGNSEICPNDVYKGDGAYCGHYNEGHCYQGKCGSHSKRCTRLFGDRATAADNSCFKEFAFSGNRIGNCGQDSSTSQYIKCDEDSSMCGTLYCNARGNTKVKMTERKRHHTNQRWAGSSVCQYIEGYVTHYSPEDWLTVDGARCGDRKMCINQKCRQVSGTDDGLTCPRKCNSRGICNNRGNCHCQSGYGGRDCSQPGPGGSVDSGPMGDAIDGGRRPINPVTHRPPKTRPLTTTPRYDWPKRMTPRYRRPRPTTPWRRRPRPTTPWHRRPRPTTPWRRRPWTPTRPHDKWPQWTTATPPLEGDKNLSGTFLKSPGMIAVWVLLTIFMLLVILCILVCCSWDKIRNWWEETGRTQVSQVAPRAALCVDNCFCTAVSKAVQWMVSSGPLGKIKKPFETRDQNLRRDKKKSLSFNVEIEDKRISHPDYINTDEYKNGKNFKGPILPNKSPKLHHNSLEKITRPKYHQSISVDSGCVIDDSDDGLESPSTNVSMSSLVNAFRNYAPRTSNETSEAENRKSHVTDHQREVSLRRLVTDPLAGRRKSNHHLPQPYQKPPETRHSISADSTLNNAGSNNIANNTSILSNKSNKDDRGLPSVHSKITINNKEVGRCVKKPIMPPQRARTPPRTLPSRDNLPRSSPPRSAPPRDPPPAPPNRPVASQVLQNRKQTSGTRTNERPGFLPNSQNANANLNNGPRVTGNRNVKNMAQRFENL